MDISGHKGLPWLPQYFLDLYDFLGEWTYTLYCPRSYWYTRLRFIHSGEFLHCSGFCFPIFLSPLHLVLYQNLRMYLRCCFGSGPICSLLYYFTGIQVLRCPYVYSVNLHLHLLYDWHSILQMHLPMFALHAFNTKKCKKVVWNKANPLATEA